MTLSRCVSSVHAAALGLLLLQALGAASAEYYAKVEVKQGSKTVLNSDVLPGNVLPNFLFQQGSIEGGSVGLKIGGGRGSPHKFTPDDSCGDDIFDGAMSDMRSPQLPYLTQDLWTCDRKEETMPVWTMENEYLRVTITPQYAGKVWSIYDKKRERDLLYNNRAHQPANIGALKAWAAGGAEWNWSPGIIGHSAFTETQVYMGKLDTEKGPMLRVYEFDRYNGTVWQVDMLLLNDSFVAHPRITNPTTADLRGYWWTCVAVESRPSTRIYAPATHVAETSRDPMRRSGWPYFAEALENASFSGYQDQFMTDNSYIGNHQIGDMFLRIPEPASELVDAKPAAAAESAPYTPYIAHSQEGEDGYVLVHGHPLNGTKFFTWGQSGPGRFMQDFLAGGRSAEEAAAGVRPGDYTELQVGPAPTQMQNFPVPAQSVIQWTEWFKGFNGNEDVLRSGDKKVRDISASSSSSTTYSYQDALDSIDAWISSDKGMPRSRTQELEYFFEHYATVPPSELLVEGQPWGALEEQLTGKKLAPGLIFTLPPSSAFSMLKNKHTNSRKLRTASFSAPLSSSSSHSFISDGVSGETLKAAEAVPWMELLSTGEFSNETLANSVPVSYQTTDDWLAILEKSKAFVEKKYLSASAGAGKAGSASDIGVKTWLHDLYLAVAYAERGELTRPTDLLKQSLAKNPQNAVAARCLAVLSQTPEEAWVWLQRAWSIAVTNSKSQQQVNSQHSISKPTTTSSGGDGVAVSAAKALAQSPQERLVLNLVTEISSFLQQEMWYEEMQAFVDSVESLSHALFPSLLTLSSSTSSRRATTTTLATVNSVHTSAAPEGSAPISAARFQTSNAELTYLPDAYLTLQIKLLLHSELYEDALLMLGDEGTNGCFPTYAKARSDLMDMWHTAVEGQALQEKAKEVQRERKREIVEKSSAGTEKREIIRASVRARAAQMNPSTTTSSTTLTDSKAVRWGVTVRPIAASASSAVSTAAAVVQVGREGQSEEEEALQLTEVEKHQARMATPIPNNIGCQYASEYCINYW